MRDTVIPAMEDVREVADRLEKLVADDLWPLPKYSEMLFIKWAWRPGRCVVRRPRSLVCEARSPLRPYREPRPPGARCGERRPRARSRPSVHLFRSVTEESDGDRCAAGRCSRAPAGSA